MKKLVTLVSSAAMAVSMFAVPVSQVSAATTTQQPVKVTQTSNQPSKAEVNKVAAAMQGSLIVVKNAKGLPQVKIVDEGYLASSLKKTNVSVSINDVKSALTQLNSYITSHPSEFTNDDTEDSPLLRHVTHSKACKNTFNAIGTIGSAAFKYGSSVAGAGIAGWAMGEALGLGMHGIAHFVC
ncbi:hypothetical protein OZY43_00725 [Lactobacillus sp. ESL0785]|uniref:hypothetical protein n=1 Tax=Lactobacillus sp. ESL0785 TaxID=2983232 RepID=UPI0023F90B6C|nr:hypothetical protein [Lactobacillus sp. ESL0785]WEV70994.1 hypothetical protein OZY43_00725 [Lactobacillus sp. ESL0785]